jgi:hypothetical protein
LIYDWVWLNISKLFNNSEYYILLTQAKQEEQAEETKARELEKQLAFLESEPHLDGM